MEYNYMFLSILLSVYDCGLFSPLKRTIKLLWSRLPILRYSLDGVLANMPDIERAEKMNHTRHCEEDCMLASLNRVNTPMKGIKTMMDHCSAILGEGLERTFLDIGCMHGQVMLPFYLKGYKCLGIDKCSGFLNHTQWKGYNFIQTDVEDFQPNNMFTVGFCQPNRCSLKLMSKKLFKHCYVCYTILEGDMIEDVVEMAIDNDYHSVRLDSWQETIKEFNCKTGHSEVTKQYYLYTHRQGIKTSYGEYRAPGLRFKDNCLKTPGSQGPEQKINICWGGDGEGYLLSDIEEAAHIENAFKEKHGVIPDTDMVTHNIDEDIEHISTAGRYLKRKPNEKEVLFDCDLRKAYHRRLNDKQIKTCMQQNYYLDDKRDSRVEDCLIIRQICPECDEEKMIVNADDTFLKPMCRNVYCRGFYLAKQTVQEVEYENIEEEQFDPADLDDFEQVPEHVEDMMNGQDNRTRVSGVNSAEAHLINLHLRALQLIARGQDPDEMVDTGFDEIQTDPTFLEQLAGYEAQGLIAHDDDEEVQDHFSEIGSLSDHEEAYHRYDTDDDEDVFSIRW